MTARSTIQARRRRHRQAADWLLRNRQPGQPPQEARAFADWLAQAPENRAAYEAAERLMADASGAIMSDPELRDFNVARRSPARNVLALLAVLGLGGGLFVLADGPMRLAADTIAGTGEMPVLTLADGSVMQLNATAAVAYDFTPSRRVVRLLRGEAYFQVAKDSQRPFTVEAGGGRVTALGTAFNVRLGASATEVVVTEHAVSLTAPAAPAPSTVREEQGAVYDADGIVRTIAPVDASARLAWRRGQLVVDDAPLADVIAELQRHFSGRIVIGSAALSDRRVSGTLSVRDTNAALAFLTDALNLTVTRLGPLIFIRG